MHNTRDSFSSKEFVGNGIVYLKTKNNTKVFDPKSIPKTWDRKWSFPRQNKNKSRNCWPKTKRKTNKENWSKCATTLKDVISKVSSFSEVRLVSFHRISPASIGAAGNDFWSHWVSADTVTDLPAIIIRSNYVIIVLRNLRILRIFLSSHPRKGILLFSRTHEWIIAHVVITYGYIYLDI